MRFKGRLKLIKRFVPKTLFGRSLLILVIPVVLIQAGSTYLFFDRHWIKITNRLSYGVAGEIAWIAYEINKDGNAERIKNVSDNSLKYIDILVNYTAGVKLNAQTKKDRWDGWEYMIGNSLERELDRVLLFPFILDVDFQEKWVEVNVQLDNGVLSLSVPQRRLFSSSGYIFLLWVYFISICLLTIAVLFMRNQVRSIRRLGIAAEKFGKGQDVSDFKVEGAKEVRQAGQAFLDMRTRIQRQINQRTEMLAGVSHDLRTPLTRMKLQLAMMPSSTDIQALNEDICDMEVMIDGYLNFVRGEGPEQMQKTDLIVFLKEIINAENRHKNTIQFENNQSEVIVNIRNSAFKRCIMNIISNARRYAEKVILRVDCLETGKIDIVIEDNGCGIPEEQYEDVFRPFYRADTSRNSQTGGVGLGLPIAMDIVHAHGGKIWLEKSTLGGLAVFIRLPA